MTPTTFTVFGHTPHLLLANAQGMEHALELDEAHWVAVSAPCSTLEADTQFLALLDKDSDGRIRAEDVKHAMRWLLSRLTSTQGIDCATTTLMMSTLRTDDDEGQRIARAAAQVQERTTQKEDTTQVTLAHIRKVRADEEAKGLSEAGLVLPSAAEDEATRQLIDNMLATLGGHPHPLGEQGVSQETLDQFLDQTGRFLAWRDRVNSDPSLLPLGEHTEEVAELVARLDDKIEEHFTLADAVRLNPRIAAAVWPTDAELDAINFADPAAVRELLVDGPLAPPESNAALNFEGPINPHYAPELERLRTHLALLLDLKSPPGTLERSTWLVAKERLAPYRAWRAERPDVAVAELGVEQLRAHHEDPNRTEELQRLLGLSHEHALVLDDVKLLEQLALFQGHMLTFVNSFVSFPDLYDPSSRALFEMGTLIMDGRHFTLAVKVPDRARHARLSSASNMFVLYARISDREGDPLYEVAVPVTHGGRGNLQEGKWGIFKAIDGSERHAQIIQIVENPISLREALWAPFQRLGQNITKRLEQMTASAETEFHKEGTSLVTRTGAVGPSPTATVAPSTQTPSVSPTSSTPSASATSSPFGGVVAGGGIALAALGSSLAFILQTLASVPWTSLLVAFFVASLLVLTPMTLVAWLKLRRRDLSAILEGSGWGINASMFLTRAQARTFTFIPPYPEKSQGLIHSRGWVLICTIVALVCAAWLIWSYVPGVQGWVSKLGAMNAVPSAPAPQLDAN
ncbi:MAG: hypothetical protein AAFX99_08740 [Myxococcota bacterium]